MAKHNMFLQLFLLSLAVYATRCSEPVDSDGYLFVNMSAPYSCITAPKTKLCSLDYKIFQFDDTVGKALIPVMFSVVEIALKTLDYYSNVTEECRENVRYYGCNNTFSVCDSDDKGHVTGVHYNWRQTLGACEKVNKVCPKEARPYLTNDCAFINKNPMDYTKCVNIPSEPSNICSEYKPNYKYQLPNATPYRVYIKYLEQTYNYFLKQLLPDEKCRQNFLSINCKIDAGPICSTDGKLRMFSISRQDCGAMVNGCFKGQVLERIKPVYLLMCNILPDKSAPRVPLPTPSMARV